MGVDADLLISNRFTLDDVLTVMRSLPDVKEVTAKNTAVLTMLDITVDFSRKVGEWGNGKPITQRSIYFHFGEKLHLSMRANDHATEFFTAIAERIGGELCKEDCNGEYEHFPGMLWEESGLPYFLLYAVTKGYMKDNSDLAGLVKAIKEWGSGRDSRIDLQAAKKAIG